MTYNNLKSLLEKIERESKAIFDLQKPISSLVGPELEKLLLWYTKNPKGSQDSKADKLASWTKIVAEKYFTFLWKVDPRKRSQT